MKEHLFEHNDEQDYKSQRDFKKINAVTTIVVKKNILKTLTKT